MDARAERIREVRLPGGLELTLRRFNPWWEGKPGRPLPPHPRHLVRQIERRLADRLAPIVAVRGARQIGKTTSELHVLAGLLRRGVAGPRVLSVQFDEIEGLSQLGDDPILRLVDWYERAILGHTLNEAAAQGEPVYLFFDEVQNLPSWAPQLKALVDSSAVQVVLTGSSALRIELGRDSLAGRVSTIEAGVLSLTEIATLHGLDLGPPFLADNGLSPLLEADFWRALAARGRSSATLRDQAFRHFSERGGYPLGHAHGEVDWAVIADQLNETVIRRVIQHDLRVGERGRKRDASLLEEVFRLACRYAGQAPAVHSLAEEVRRGWNAQLGDERVRHTLRFLGEALLVRAIEPLEIRLKRRRGAAKLCLVDHGLRASWLQEIVPLDPQQLLGRPDLSTLAGRIAESVVGATLSTINGLDVAHLPERRNQPEIDFVLTVGTSRIPIEVKYQATLDPVRDTAGLRAFLAQPANHAPFGLLVTRTEPTVELDPRIVALPLSSLLLLR